MTSVFDRMRAGEVVDIDAKRKGRLNLEKRTFETSDGRTMYVGDDPDFFPQDEEALKLSREKEGIESTVAKIPGGEFLYQASETGIPKAISSWYHKLTKSGDDYQRKLRANQEVSERISERSPYASALGTAAGYAPDLALTRGLSGLAAGPVLTAAHAGPRIIEEPVNVAGEALASAAGGWLVEKGAKGLAGMASRRGKVRNLPAEQEAVKAQNIAGKENVRISNIEERNKFNSARQNVRLSNEQMKASATAQEKLAKEQYDKAVKALPLDQKRAQLAYSGKVSQAAKKIEDSFPKDAIVNSSSFGTEKFIEDSIKKSGLAGTVEGNKAAKIIKSLFPEGEAMSANDIYKRYIAIEESIFKSAPELQNVLTQFKDHLGQRMPAVLADSLAYYKATPFIRKKIQEEARDAIDKMNLPILGARYRSDLSKKMSNNLNEFFKNLSSNDFIESLRNGELKELLKSSLLKIEDFADVPSHFLRNVTKRKGVPVTTPGYMTDRQKEFNRIFSSKIDNVLSEAEKRIITAEADASIKLGRKVNQTLGKAQPVPMPNPPVSTPPQLLPEPIMPPEQMFTPQPTPSLPAPSGMAENAADMLENSNLLGGKSLVNNPLTKIAGLKYMLGKAALPLEAGYGAMKGLTSPTAGGQMARMAFRDGGIQAIAQWASKYPSYQNGILQSPMDRRSLTKEIEDDQSIPIEKKALIQSKINRGQSLQPMQ